MKRKIGCMAWITYISLMACLLVFEKDALANEQLATGGNHLLFIKADGTLWALGENDYGQLGIGVVDYDEHDTPVQVGTDNDWKSVAAGRGDFSIALKNDGTIWTWGYNGDGQLGNGTADWANPQPTPMPGPTGNDWEKIYAGSYHSLAIKTDGTLWAWGWNYKGVLGQGTSDWDPHPDPVQIGVANYWQTVATGYNHNLALRTDGTLWAWGDNGQGQLGDGTNTESYVPKQVGGGKIWKEIGAGTAQSLAITTGGLLYRWGDGNYGLGTGDWQDQLSPVQIGIDTDWSLGDARTNHGMALKDDGTLWGVGRNDRGELGDGTYDGLGSYKVRLSFVPVGTDSDWSTVSTGAYFTAAIKTDGSLWAWGQINGQNVPTLIEFPADPCGSDSDGDGFNDCEDNCPTVGNPLQYDLDNDGLGLMCDPVGPDQDDDGYEDSLDNCPADPNPRQADPNGNGIGIVCDGANDQDWDGITDDVDNCLTVQNPRQYDLDNDGIGLMCDTANDQDSDGITDDVDNCPNDPNPQQRDLDNDGIGVVCDTETVDDQARVDHAIWDEQETMNGRARYQWAEDHAVSARYRWLKEEAYRTKLRLRRKAEEEAAMSALL